MNEASFERAIARLPRWMLALAVAGTIAAGSFLGLNAAGGFLAGSLASFANLRLIERAVNRVTRIVHPDGTDIQNVYDASGQMIAQIDERGQRTSFEYDAMHRRTKVSMASAGQSSKIESA